jgi:hypothetical protein
MFLLRRGPDTVYLLLYVNDIVLTASSPGLLCCIISCLQQEFAMKDLGALHHFLGITVERRPHGMFLHQHSTPSTSSSALAWPSASPARPRWTRRARSPPPAPVADPTGYRSIAGALQYLIFTRPDIAYVVQQICLHMHDPREPYLTAMKGILVLAWHPRLWSPSTPVLDHGASRLHRCRLGRLSRHAPVHLGLCRVPRGQPHLLVVQAPVGRLPLQRRGRVPRRGQWRG